MPTKCVRWSYGPNLSTRKRIWHRDEQYFHYLTKWVHALHAISRTTNEACQQRWAMELAQAADRAFVYEVEPDLSNRMYWKMSVDLGR